MEREDEETHTLERPRRLMNETEEIEGEGEGGGTDGDERNVRRRLNTAGDAETGEELMVVAEEDPTETRDDGEMAEEQSTLDQFEHKLAEMEVKWVQSQSRDGMANVRWVYEGLGFAEEDRSAVDPAELDERLNKACEEWFDALIMLKEATQERQISTEDGMHIDFTHRLNKLNGAIHSAKVISMAIAQSQAIIGDNGTEEGADEGDVARYGMFRFRPLEKDANLTDVQDLLLFLLRTCFLCNYRKRGDLLMQEVMSPDGFGTCAWKEVCDVEKFVYQQCGKEQHFDRWLQLSASANNVKSITDYMTRSSDSELPDLLRDKSNPCYSFANGLYICKEARFVAHNSPYKKGKRIVAIRHIDLELHAGAHEGVPFFEDETGNEEDVFDWYNSFETPVFDRLINVQFNVEDDEEQTTEVRKWMYALMGRLMYPVGLLDDWQVMVFLKGVAGSGKSTICRVAEWLYRKDDIGVLSNNMERKFGLSSIHDKSLVRPHTIHSTRLPSDAHGRHRRCCASRRATTWPSTRRSCRA